MVAPSAQPGQMQAVRHTCSSYSPARSRRPRTCHGEIFAHDVVRNDAVGQRRPRLSRLTPWRSRRGEHPPSKAWLYFNRIIILPMFESGRTIIYKGVSRHASNVILFHIGNPGYVSLHSARLRHGGRVTHEVPSTSISRSLPPNAGLYGIWQREFHCTARSCH